MQKRQIVPQLSDEISAGLPPRGRGQGRHSPPVQPGRSADAVERGHVETVRRAAQKGGGQRSARPGGTFCGLV